MDNPEAFPDEVPGEREAEGLDAAMIARLPVEPYTPASLSATDPAQEAKADGEGGIAGGEGAARRGEEPGKCAICLGEYEEGENVLTLPCLHRFHERCVTLWFKRATKCPLCKNQVAASDASEDAG
ncbi:hypothetical protein T484DRAFT_2423632 [Baffinella frigidus]|nr:hypothetical protein T484DRAFT_2423632 [Cryptophyta sp. CCMP2293]